MQANTMNLFGISFILVSCLASLCVQTALANWPVFSIEKGGTAVVPCVPKGDETAYFWSKGEDFATSQSVASRVLGIPSSDLEKYSVNENGSLVIYNVTLAEGGRYHCRIVSENTNCRGAVTIEVTIEVNDKSSARWIVPLVLLILETVFTVFLLIYIYEKRGKYAQKNKRFNITTVEQQQLLQQKGGELKKLQDELKYANIALEAVKKDLTTENMTLKTANGILKKAQEDLTAKNKTLTTANGILKKAQEDLTAKNKTLTEANGELKNVRDFLTAKNTTLTIVNGVLEKAQEDLTAKNKTLTTANGVLKNAQEDLTAKNKTLTDANIALEAVKEGLTAENMTLKDRCKALEKVEKDLTAKIKTQTPKKRKPKDLQDKFKGGAE
ncbi:uncharacterized protein [Apostichopus japonicus]|uniref:uncharacterized protein isoform X3 n=1 Tax=Stichopus japonicus TaxID=307972 RepID=UPI003AB7FBBE